MDDPICPIHKQSIYHFSVFGSTTLKCSLCPDPLRWGHTGKPAIICATPSCRRSLFLDVGTFWDSRLGIVRCDGCSNVYIYLFDGEVLRATPVDLRAVARKEESELKKAVMRIGILAVEEVARELARIIASKFFRNNGIEDPDID